MTTPGGDVVFPTSPSLGVDSNVSSTANSGLSPVNRAVFNTTAMRELAEAMTEPPDPGAVNRRWGIVAAFHGAPTYTVDVTVGGVLVPGLAYDAAYTPTVNEVVMLDVVGTDTVVIGTTAPGQWRTGQIEPTFLSIPKAGALFCQGQTLSRTTYANLWSWITANGLSGGKPFGNGDGSTTFTLPDLRGRMPIGAGTLGTDTYAVGDLPGAARVTLATNQMPSHNHSVSATATQAAHTHSFSATTANDTHNHTGTSDYMNQNWNHSHGVPAAYTGSTTHSHGGAFPGYAAEGPNPGAQPAAYIGTDGTVSGTSGSTTATSTVTVTQSTVGGNTPVDVRQPSFVVNWLIYV